MPAYFPPRAILVATDFGPASEAALGHVRYLAECFLSRVTVLHAQPFEVPVYFDPGQVAALQAQIAEGRAAAETHAREVATALLGQSPEVAIAEGPPVAVILHALESGFDLVVMGSHGRRGAARAFLGSVAENVIRLSPRPVLVVRAGTEVTPYRVVLCPLGRGDSSGTVLDYAAALAAATGARLETLHVREKGHEDEALLPVREVVAGRAEVEEMLATGNAAEAIHVASLARKSDLLVMGSRRKSGLVGSLFSTTTERVLRTSPAPVLVVPVGE